MLGVAPIFCVTEGSKKMAVSKPDIEKAGAALPAMFKSKPGALGAGDVARRSVLRVPHGSVHDWEHSAG